MASYTFVPDNRSGFSEHFQIAHQLRTVARPRGFQVLPVSWEDCSRGFVGTDISCWGSNITDVRITDREKRTIYTVRSENWNERIAVMSTDDIAVVIGNTSSGPNRQLTSITLTEYLSRLGTLGAYAGVPNGTDFRKREVDTHVSVRFQTVFVPAGCQFTVNTYCYGTMSNDNPQNLLLLCTSQGTSVDQQKRKAANVYLHNQGQGQVEQKWLQAHESTFEVGGEQKETVETASAAAASGRAFARNIGVKGMGTRFNTVMLVQVPMKQRPSGTRGFSGFGYAGGAGGSFLGTPSVGAGGAGFSVGPLQAAFSATPSVGCSSAARVSMGDDTDEKYQPLEAKTFERHAEQHITVTITMYYAVEGGVPAAADIIKAVDDLEKLYKECKITVPLQEAQQYGLTDSVPVTGPPTKVLFAPPTNLSPQFPVNNSPQI